MTHRTIFPSCRPRHALRITLAASALALLSACDEPLDFDLRGLGGGFTTAGAAKGATADRPQPDDRGVISYPNYQVVVAERDDTVADVAARVGADAQSLATFNGLPIDAPLRRGEIIALPGRVAEPSPATGAIGTGPILPEPVDVTTLAGQAIDNAPETTPAPAPAPTPAAAPAPQTGEEPIRHKVARGETVYTLARLYSVPVKSLAEWNGLGPDFAIREGQYLLIPVSRKPAPQQAAAAPSRPGAGSPTPEPPSAKEPLPEETDVAAAPAVPDKPVADLGTQTKPTPQGKLAYPVQGTIIRDYAKGRNEGINIQAAAGTPVKAAETGTVAAITESAEGVPIIVIRHPDNLLTVYANVTDVSVRKGDQVRRGQGIARLRDGDQNYVHFEVRQGFDSVDPNNFL